MSVRADIISGCVMT